MSEHILSIIEFKYCHTTLIMRYIIFNLMSILLFFNDNA